MTKGRNVTITLSFRPYETPWERDSGYLDPSTFVHSDALLSGEWRDKRALDPTYFQKSLVELSLLSDLYCLRDRVHYFCGEPPDSNFHAGLPNEPFEFRMLSSLQALLGPIAPLSFVTVDVEQKSRIFERWHGMTRAVNAEDNVARSELEKGLDQAMLGALIEELLPQISYVPSITATAAYLASDPRETELAAHNLLLATWNRLDRSFRQKGELRDALAGVSQPRLPPLLAMTLEKISKPEELPEELNAWRRRLKPLRKRYTDLALLSGSEMPLANWEKEYVKLNRDIEKFLRKFEIADPWQQSRGTSPWDLGTGSEKWSKDGLSSQLELKVSTLVRLGLEGIVTLVGRQRIRPLPSIRSRLGRLRSTNSRLRAVFATEWEDGASIELHRLAETQDARWDRLANAKTASIRVKRTPVRRLDHIEMFSVDSLIQEYRKRASAEDSKLGYAKAMTDIGLIALEGGGLARAASFFIHVVKRAPKRLSAEWREVKGMALASLGRIHAQTGSRDEAIESLVRAQKTAPKSAWVLNEFGAFLSPEDPEQAETFFRKALSSDPDFAVAWLNLGNCLVKDRTADAIECFRRASLLENQFTERALSLLGNALKQDGQIQEAIQTFRQLADRDNANAGNWLDLLAAHLQANDYVNAVRTVDEAQGKCRDVAASERWVDLSAYSLLMADEYARVIASYDGRVQRGKGSPLLLESLAAAHRALGNHKESIQRYLEAHAKSPGGPDYLFRIVDILLKDGERVAALRYAQRSVREFPESSDTFARCGDVLYALGRIADALRTYRKAVAAGFKSQAKFYNLATKREQVHDWKHAIEFHQLNIEMGEELAECYANLAADLSEVGKQQEALASAKRAVELDPHDPINVNMLANMLCVHGQYDLALEAFEGLLLMDINDVRMREAAEASCEAIRQSQQEAPDQ